ncbi:hypothetical protein [Xanthomonas nasturtii]|uniref:hypothetical protein n=1 Tax=Xanthomonas nasturtii TaxID=1843581 RepID=UPI002012FAD8|nr:hypothetical protein [Xanthomonas nasturtii]MCL1500348.1 hypothetical protein [Xanthomonas nasturtii]MCL1504106.1 hypothetical protein [Xanthomonas nasturtii]MCL1523983.1 hypothetical protein [Xanthomonas nasturtii]
MNRKNLSIRAPGDPIGCELQQTISRTRLFFKTHCRYLGTPTKSTVAFFYNQLHIKITRVRCQSHGKQLLVCRVVAIDNEVVWTSVQSVIKAVE